MRTVCKCHGMSGSCNLKTCWRKLPMFSHVGNILKSKFNSASKVAPNNNGNGFIPVGDIEKVPSREDIVYSEESSNFCEYDSTTGSLGTTGRQCSLLSGVDSCDSLCCNRGYTNSTINQLVNCNCRFKWCCSVMCDTCVVQKQIHRCL